MDLGYKDEMPTPTSLGQKGKDKKRYPEFTLRGKPAKDFLKANECEPGEEYTGDFRIKVTRVSNADNDDAYGGTSIEAQILSIDDYEHADGEGSKEDEDEEKTLGYKRPKNKPEKETPDTSAASME